MIFGFKTENAELASLIAGGGAISMVSPVGIVAISAFYSGIFEATGLLENVISLIIKMAEKLGEFTATVITSVLTSMLGFNQTLSIMLSHQLCKDVYGEDESGLAIALENSVVLMAGLVPWSIAGSVPLLSVGATNGSMAFSFYLIIVPLWGIFVEHFKKKKK